MSQSGPAPQARAPAPKSTPQVKLSPEDQKEKAAADAALDRMKRLVGRDTPYIVSAPSIDPHVHRLKHDRVAWMVGDLFDWSEEHLQYRSWLYREPCQDCFVLQPGEELRPPVEQPKPRASTTPHIGPKKTIAFKDSAYNKSKQASSASTPVLHRKDDMPAIAPPKEITMGTNGVREPKQQHTAPGKHEETKSSKR